MRAIIIFLLLGIGLCAAAQERDLSLFGNLAAFGVVLDTFAAPVGPGAELGVQVAHDGFFGHGSVRRSYVGQGQQRTSYNMIQAGLGGTHSVFFFSATLDYMMINRKGESRSNGGALGAGIRFGVDIPVLERLGLFGVVNLGVNRLHTYTYLGLGASYHFPWDPSGVKASFFGEPGNR